MRLGIEVEFTGMSKLDVANILRDYFESSIEMNVVEVDNEERVIYKVEDYKGDIWTVVEDRSINSDNGEFDNCCELVTPILEEYEDLFEILDDVKNLGGVVNDTCGIHIHIDKPTNSELFCIIREFFNIQEGLVSKFNIPRYRLEKYCKLFPKEFIKGFLECFDSCSHIKNMIDFGYVYLGNFDVEKNPLRYYMLNLDSINKLGTLEFRMFNSTLEKDELKGYIDWVVSFVTNNCSR